MAELLAFTKKGTAEVLTEDAVYFMKMMDETNYEIPFYITGDNAFRCLRGAIRMQIDIIKDKHGRK